MFFAEMTDYPRIFESCYWGQFKVESSRPDQDMSAIFANRNAFAQEFSLVRISPSTRVPQYASRHVERSQNTDGWLDHPEIYKDSEGQYVVVTSPYREHDRVMSDAGWTKYRQLYMPNAHTYVKRITRSTPPLPSRAQ